MATKFVNPWRAENAEVLKTTATDTDVVERELTLEEEWAREDEKMEKDKKTLKDTKKVKQTKYKISFNEEANSISVKYSSEGAPTTIDLGSDLGAKYRMLLAEGGYNSIKAFQIDKNGRGIVAERDSKVHRETLFGLLIISATIENRKRVLNNSANDKLKLYNYWGDGKTYASLFKKSEYNGVSELAYTNFWAWKRTLEKAGRTENDITSFIGDVAFALEELGFMLSLLYRFESANKVLSYSHNKSNPKLFNNESIDFDKSLTLIEFMNSKTDIIF
jgi:hypothetical protein